MLRFMLVVLIALTMVSIYAEWDYLGLSGNFIHKIRLYEDYLYANTDNGLYKKDNNSPDTVWTHLGFEGQRLGGLLIIDHNTFIVGTLGFTGDEFIFRSDNGGEDWYPFEEGIQYDRNLYIHDFTYYSEEPQTIIATGNAAIIRHTTETNRWDLVFGGWHSQGMGIHFIRIDPLSTNIVWAGGEFAMFAPYLVKSQDYGANWEQINIDAGGDNACHIIAIDPQDNDVLYVGMEGIIIKSYDGGMEWEVIFDSRGNTDNYDFWGIAVSSHDSNLIYAPIHTRNIYQELKVLISYDAGSNWNIIRGEYGKNMVTSMQYRALDEIDELYMATNGGGVHRFTKEFSEVNTDQIVKNVDTSSTTDLKSYPNPFNPETTISFTLVSDERVKLEIFNLKGQPVALLVDHHLPKGKHSYRWNSSDERDNSLGSGLYFYKLTTDTTVKIGKMILIK